MTGIPAPGTIDENPKAIVEALAARWASLGLGGHVEELVDLYSNYAIFFGSMPHMFSGKAGVAEYFRSVPLAALTSVEFHWQEARAIAPTVINAGGLVRFGMEVDGTPASWRFGIVWTLLKTHSDWKIAAHHASPREL